MIKKLCQWILFKFYKLDTYDFTKPTICNCILNINEHTQIYRITDSENNEVLRKGLIQNMSFINCELRFDTKFRTTKGDIIKRTRLLGTCKPKGSWDIKSRRK